MRGESQINDFLFYFLDMHVEGTYGENGINFPSLKELSSVFAWLSSLAKFMITSIQNSIISKRIKSRNDFILIFLKRKTYMLLSGF
jgi:hypothetical protein